ncbi:Hypothetical predicted protein, partial [Xyrichtys novacula]
MDGSDGEEEETEEKEGLTGGEGRKEGRKEGKKEGITVWQCPCQPPNSIKSARQLGPEECRTINGVKLLELCVKGGLASLLAPRQVRSAFNDPPGNPYLMGQLSKCVQSLPYVFVHFDSDEDTKYVKLRTYTHTEAVHPQPGGLYALSAVLVVSPVRLEMGHRSWAGRWEERRQPGWHTDWRSAKPSQPACDRRGQQCLCDWVMILINTHTAGGATGQQCLDSSAAQKCAHSPTSLMEDAALKTM